MTVVPSGLGHNAAQAVGELDDRAANVRFRKARLLPTARSGRFRPVRTPGLNVRKLAMSQRRLPAREAAGMSGSGLKDRIGWIADSELRAAECLSALKNGGRCLCLEVAASGEV